MAYLACLAVLLCSAIWHLSTPVSSQDLHYPPGWWDAPDSLDDFPVKQIDGKTMTNINPWDYQQRMGIFKLMVQKTHGYFKSWGYNNTGNLLWGLPLQFGWQMTSGRLRDMADSKKCAEEPCVSPNSWWADMNYYLSVLPFLGALNAGVFAPLKHPVYIEKPSDVSDELKQKLCTSVQECSVDHADVIEDWTEFFERVKVGTTQQSSYEQDATVALMWKAHTTSILKAQPLFTEQVDLLSLPEKQFGVGWALLVEFIAATHFRTDLNDTALQQYALPPRLLKSDDKVPLIPDFTAAQNRALLAINFFHNTNVDTNGLLLKVWRRAMCSAKGRVIGRDLLEKLIQDPWIIPKKLLKLLWGLLFYRCD